MFNLFLIINARYISPVLLTFSPLVAVSLVKSLKNEKSTVFETVYLCFAMLSLWGLIFSAVL